MRAPAIIDPVIIEQIIEKIVSQAPVRRGRPRSRTVSAKIGQAGNFYRGFALLGLLAALLVPNASAQRSGAGASGHTGSAAHAIQHSGSVHAHYQQSASRRAPYFSPYTSLPFPFFTDAFDPNDIYSTGYPVADDPPPFLLQAARSMAGPAAGSMDAGMSPFANRESRSVQPLMIELQNGRYVRVNSSPANGEVLQLSLASPAAPPHDQPNAVLIFRDGHTEEVHDYAIADGILYARGDYYTDGYWNKQIALATLNMAETLEANATRNVKFVLPASPNEVITRP
jgi:hypothetical protein